MLFVTELVKKEEINTIEEYVNEYDTGIVAVSEDTLEEVNNVSKYITSYVSSYYQKSVEDIENTRVGNKLTRKRNLRQAMRESFFYGANRFGNNFIA